jgi:ParB/RepB/Spo0J family partition protein
MTDKDDVDEVLSNLEDGDEDKGASKKKPGKGAKSKPDSAERLPDVFPTELLSVAVSSITDIDDGNTREDMGSDAEMDAFTGTVAKGGIFVPLEVADNGDGSYRLLSGQRRLEAAKRIDMQFVPAVVVDPDRQDVRVVAAIENLTRKDLNPIEEANAFRVLMAECKMTQEQLSEAIGIQQSRISRALQLLKAPKKLQKELAEGDVSESKVRAHVKARKEGKPVVVPIKIGSDSLPDGVSVTIKDKAVNASFKFQAENMKNIGKSVRTQIAKLLRAIDEGDLNSSYRATKKEIENS